MEAREVPHRAPRPIPLRRARYHYGAPVNRCRNEAHLCPRDTDRQTCVEHDLVVDPAPTGWGERADFYGNPVTTFVVDGPSVVMTVTAVSTVDVIDVDPLPAVGPIWTEALDLLTNDLSPDMLDAREFCFESPLVSTAKVVRDYAEPSFATGAPLVDAVTDLTERIHRDFIYDPGFTTVTTPVDEVLDHWRGVCQDFAHLAVGCVRSMGPAARYCSGYLETAPPPGTERLVGADASHAWLSEFVPGWGWLDLDPTNDKIVGSNSVTTAQGRDFGDVSPLKGIVFGGGDSHTLDASVDVAGVEHPAE